MARHRLRPAVAVALLFVSTVAARPVAAADEGYVVKFARPSKVGDRFHLDAVGAIRSKQVQKPRGADPVTQEQAFGVSLEGVVTVLAVNDKGAETKMSIAVESCAVAVGGKQVPVLEAGTVVTAEWDKARSATAYTAKGKPLDDLPAEAIGLVFNASDPDGATDDEIFGSDARRKVGDAWPVNAAAAVKELERIGFKAKEEHVFGETTLAEAGKADDGEPTALFKTTFKVRKMTGTGRAGGGEDAEAAKARDGSMDVTTSVTLPVDPAKQPVRDETNMTITTESVAADKAGKPVATTRTTERAAERTIKALPAK